MPITSPNNEALKEVRKLAGRKWRDKTRTFVAEGEDLVEAAAAASRARSANRRKVSGSRTAMSASTLRSSSIPASLSPWMNCE